MLGQMLSVASCPSCLASWVGLKVLLPFLCDGLRDAWGSSSFPPNLPIPFTEALEHSGWAFTCLTSSHVDASNLCHSQYPKRLPMWQIIALGMWAVVNLPTQPIITLKISKKTLPSDLFLFRVWDGFAVWWATCFLCCCPPRTFSVF